MARKRNPALIFLEKIIVKNLLKYFTISVLFWIVVDFTTAFNPNFTRWIAHMPFIWLFYLGYPLLFALLIYKLNWQGKKLLLAMIIASFGLEAIVFHNPILLTFPALLIGIPLVVSLYSLITFAPKWIVDGKIRDNKKKVILMTAIWLVVAILSFMDRLK